MSSGLKGSGGRGCWVEVLGFLDFLEVEEWGFAWADLKTDLEGAGGLW